MTTEPPISSGHRRLPTHQQTLSIVITLCAVALVLLALSARQSTVTSDVDFACPPPCGPHLKPIIEEPGVLRDYELRLGPWHLEAPGSIDVAKPMPAK